MPAHQTTKGRLDDSDLQAAAKATGSGGQEPAVVVPNDPSLTPPAAQVAKVMGHYADGPATKSAAGTDTGGATVLAQSGTDRNESNPALGYLGPLGPYGPLGTLGPVGQNSWNPSNLISGSFDWSATQKQLTAARGPLSEAGPLGPNGPLAINPKDLAPSMRPGGDAAVLGPEGPLGALGPLGPLGPVGAHGYKADADGNYHDAQGNIVRGVDVAGQGGSRHYGLFENYSEKQAKKMDNDTSFMVHGSLDKSGETDSYAFHAEQEERVTVLLLPEQQLDAFELVVRDDSGKVLFDSKSMTSVNWVELQVKAGTHLHAQVKLKASFQFLTPPSYRLIVTGASQSGGGV